MTSRGLIAVAPLLLAGCSRWPAVLESSGRGAAQIEGLFWFFIIVTAAVWVLVVIALAAAILRRRSPAERAAYPLDTDPGRERLSTMFVGAAVAVTAVILVALTISSYLTGKSLAGMSDDAALTIRITGHQWWWEVRYESPEPSRMLTTANEIHIPAGEPVRLLLTSSDVIHSFWVPALAGKQDLITGYINDLVLIAEKPGVFRGQCAEFCGVQHAHMGLLVIAAPREEFDAWYAAQLAAAPPPDDPERRKGLDAFLSNPCALCHTVRGTPASGKVGPDLTHVGSRRTIAAGTLPTTRGSIAAWIADPHSPKPGGRMPRVDLAPDELNAIAGYLEGLK